MLDVFGFTFFPVAHRLGCYAANVCKRATHGPGLNPGGASG